MQLANTLACWSRNARCAGARMQLAAATRAFVGAAAFGTVEGLAAEDVVVELELLDPHAAKTEQRTQTAHGPATRLMAVARRTGQPKFTPWASGSSSE